MKKTKLNVVLWSVMIITLMFVSSCSDDKTEDIVVPDPVAGFTTSVEGKKVTITNASTNAVSYSWTFGDPAAGTSTSANPVYTYAAAGTFEITLIAKNANDVTNTIKKSVVIEDVVVEDPTKITPTELFMNFASATDAANLVYDSTSATVLTFGVDNPADATAAKVAKAQRTEAQYSDFKFRTAKIADGSKDIQFDNFTKVSIEVYFPSTNDATVVKDIAVWIADESFGNFWEDWESYSSTTDKFDQWVKFEWVLTDRTHSEKDWSYIGVKLGKDDSKLDATFFVRNFKFE